MRQTFFILCLYLVGGYCSSALAQSSVCFAPGQYRSRDAVAERLYQQGEALAGVNDAQALPYLNAAAQRGHPRALALLGIMYRDGRGVRANDEAAFRYTEQAARQGHRGAIMLMGFYYSYGPVVQPDLRRADQYLAVAARCGDPYAQVELGLNYEFGRGVARNRETALYWLDMASSWGRAHWLADWLRRSGTPRFQNIDQLDQYINAQVMRYHMSRVPRQNRTQQDCYFHPATCPPYMQPDWYKRQRQ